MPAAFGRKEFDQRTVTPGYPPVFPVVPRHPLVAECQGAEAPRVGCVVTLDGPSDRAPQFGVSRIGKMRLQKFGNGQIGLSPRPTPGKTGPYEASTTRRALRPRCGCSIASRRAAAAKAALRASRRGSPVRRHGQTRGRLPPGSQIPRAAAARCVRRSGLSLRVWSPACRRGQVHGPSSAPRRQRRPPRNASDAERQPASPRALLGSRLMRQGIWVPSAATAFCTAGRASMRRRCAMTPGTLVVSTPSPSIQEAMVKRYGSQIVY